MASQSSQERAIDDLREDPLELAELAELAGQDRGGGDAQSPARDFPRQNAERFQFNVLAAELEDLSEQGLSEDRPTILRRRKSMKRVEHGKFWHRMSVLRPGRGTDPLFNFSEDRREVIEAEGFKQVQIPSLQECQTYLHNQTADEYFTRVNKPWTGFTDTVLDILAAFYIYLVNMIGFEALIVIINTALAVYYFCINHERFAFKLDFSFLAFAVVFPLTFLLQSTFGRRDQALSFLADFKGAVLSVSLFTLTTDWPAGDGSFVGGRLALPEGFNANCVRDSREMVQLVYEYLSMPRVSHARHVVFWSKQKMAKQVHALHNDIVKEFNDLMFDHAMHLEEMRKVGFPSGEASRLHQYHQYLRQRFEHLRLFKNYRTPQATRSFGHVYVMILPWLIGPYFSSVFESTGYTTTIIIGVMTFLIVLSLLNVQARMEDPFVSDHRSWTPGLDTIKLDYEFAVLLQTVVQYYANAELRRFWRLKNRESQLEKSSEQTTQA